MRVEFIRSFKLQHGILWLGLALCVVALWQLAPDVSLQFDRIGFVTWLGWAGMLVVIWLFSVAAWRSMIDAFFERRLSWRAAARQSGMLLVGKYVPGGVFGLAARVLDTGEGESRRRHLAAGLSEQLAGILMTSCTGAILLAASVKGLQWLVLLLVVPLSTWMAIHAGLALVVRFPTLLPPSDGAVLALRPRCGKMLLSLHLAQASILGWMVLAASVAIVGFSQTPDVALALSGAFGLAVVAGLLVMFMPGGIGVRESAFVALASYWIPVPTAIAMAALLRVLSVALDVSAGLGSLLISQFAESPRGSATDDVSTKT